MATTSTVRLIDQADSPAVEQHQLLSQRQTEPCVTGARAEERAKKPSAHFGRYSRPVVTNTPLNFAGKWIDARFKRDLATSRLAGIGQETLPDNDFKLPLFLVPVPNIPAVNTNGHGAIGDGEMAPVTRAPLDERHLLFPQLRLTPLGCGMIIPDPECMAQPVPVHK